MIVFKLYWKIFRKNIIVVVIYFSLFFLITLLALSSFKEQDYSYSNTKTNITWVDLDDTKLTRGLRDYLSNYAVFKDIKEDRIEDALFYNDIKMYIEIPSGFSELLTEEEFLKIKTKSQPNDPGTMFISSIVNKYSQLARVYLKNDLVSDNLVLELKAKLDLEVEIIISSVNLEQVNSTAVYYYNYMAYIIIALVISVVSAIMLAFKPLEIKRRNQITSISNRKLNAILLLGNFILGMFILFLLIVLSLIIYPQEMFTETGLLLILNAFVFTIPMIALAYLVVTIFDSRHIISACGTIFSLGFSFITGVFIPQELLAKGIIGIAKVIPSFYYVQNNNWIVSIGNYSFNNLKDVFSNFLIQMAFTFVFIVITILVAKRRQTQES